MRRLAAVVALACGVLAGCGSDPQKQIRRSEELAIGLLRPSPRSPDQSWIDHSGQYRFPASSGSSSSRASIMV
jgi:hypothetical protein